MSQLVPYLNLPSSDRSMCHVTRLRVEGLFSHFAELVNFLCVLCMLTRLVSNLIFMSKGHQKEAIIWSKVCLQHLEDLMFVEIFAIKVSTLSSHRMAPPFLPSLILQILRKLSYLASSKWKLVFYRLCVYICVHNCKLN